MREATLSQPKHPVVVKVDNVDGDLQVVGWERDEITARTDGDSVDLRNQDGEVSLACDGDAILYLPRDASLEVQNISGDADIRALSGALKISNVAGDLQMQNVGAVSLENVAGDLRLRVCEGDFSAKSLAADVSLRDVRGAVNLGNVGADFYLRELTGNLSVNVGADAVIYLQPVPEGVYRVTAGAHILLRIPAQPDAEFELTAGTDESIRIDLPEAASTVTGPVYKLKLGEGSAKFRLIAGGDLVVTSRAREWESAAEFDRGSRGEGYGPHFHGAPLPGDFVPGDFLPADFGDRIGRTVEAATRRAQLKTEHAMRRAEEKIRASERRSMSMRFSVGRWGASVDRPISPAPPRNEQISDEERITILRMLQEKKINREEAEKLLAALEGK